MGLVSPEDRRSRAILDPCPNATFKTRKLIDRDNYMYIIRSGGRGGGVLSVILCCMSRGQRCCKTPPFITRLHITVSVGTQLRGDDIGPRAYEKSSFKVYNQSFFSS